MIVYRVQDDDGRGAYSGGAGCDATDAMCREYEALAQRRGPTSDFARARDAHRRRGVDFWDWLRAFRFAFPTVEAAYRWFPYPAMAYLERRGFFLQAVEADVVLLSDSGEQVVYRAIPPEPEAGDVRGIA